MLKMFLAIVVSAIFGAGLVLVFQKRTESAQFHSKSLLGRKERIPLNDGFVVDIEIESGELRLDYFSPEGIIAQVAFEKDERKAIFMSASVDGRGFNNVMVRANSRGRSINVISSKEGIGRGALDSDGDGVPEKIVYTDIERGKHINTLIVPDIEKKNKEKTTEPEHKN